MGNCQYWIPSGGKVWEAAQAEPGGSCIPIPQQINLKEKERREVQGVAYSGTASHRALEVHHLSLQRTGTALRPCPILPASPGSCGSRHPWVRGTPPHPLPLTPRAPFLWVSSLPPLSLRRVTTGHRAHPGNDHHQDGRSLRFLLSHLQRPFSQISHMQLPGVGMWMHLLRGPCSSADLQALDHILGCYVCFRAWSLLLYLQPYRGR